MSSIRAKTTPKRVTVALRVCMQCGDGYGVVLWPWSGEAMTRTHGVCRDCFETLDAAFDDEPDARREAPAVVDRALH